MPYRLSFNNPVNESLADFILECERKIAKRKLENTRKTDPRWLKAQAIASGGTRCIGVQSDLCKQIGGQRKVKHQGARKVGGQVRYTPVD